MSPRYLDLANKLIASGYGYLFSRFEYQVAGWDLKAVNGDSLRISLRLFADAVEATLVVNEGGDVHAYTCLRFDESDNEARALAGVLFSASKEGVSVERFIELPDVAGVEGGAQ